MVVLSSAIMTKSGKVLVARQFVKMTKLRIEGLLAAFPKLVGSGGQHTFIETENVRYLYQPIEQLYALLITNKQSNIMEDLDTLRLVAKLIPEYCHGQDEEAVSSESFSLMFAFDEVISIGYRENLTLQQVRTFTEMDSHEEKLQRIIQESKMAKAKADAAARSKELETQRREAARAQSSGLGAGFGSSGGSGSGFSSISSTNQPVYKDESEPALVRAPKSRSARKVGGGLGLQLGAVKANPDTFFAQLAGEENLAPAPPAAASRHVSTNQTLTGAAANTYVEAEEAIDGVLVTIDEAVRVKVERDGSLKKIDVQGTLKIAIGDPDVAKICVVAAYPEPPKGFRFQPHPKVDKLQWTKTKTLALKSLGKGFPIGVSNAAPVLKWKLSSDNTDLCPILFNVWPEPKNDKLIVMMEFIHENEERTLNNVSIDIPCPGVHTEPDILNCDNGATTFDYSSCSIIWSIKQILPDSNGQLEFSIPRIDSDTMFPLNISFTSHQTFSNISIVSVQHAETGEDVRFEARSTMLVESFVMQ